MGVKSYFYNQKKSAGWIDAIRKTATKIVKRILDIDKIEEENDALFYFLNSLYDVRTVPPAVGGLRDLQKCDAVLLKIFDKVCRKYNFEYWLDYGTLLGAYRHGGFIPWDDDLDVAMQRDDYNKVLPILKKELTAYGIEIVDEEAMVRIGIGYKHKATGVWLDIFPVDLTKSTICCDEISSMLYTKCLKYRKYYIRHHKKISVEEMCKIKEKIIDIPAGNKRVLYHGPEYEYDIPYACDFDDVFPLGKITFEGHEFSVPGKCELYLERIYGYNYMKFPRNGVEHHGDGVLRLSQWAAYSGTNMVTILQELDKIYCSI